MKKYIYSHISPFSRSAQNIAISILSYLTENLFSLYELDTIGCDGTVTDMGWKTSVNHTIVEVKRLLQWEISLLNFNEFPFRYLFQTLMMKQLG